MEKIERIKEKIVKYLSFVIVTGVLVAGGLYAAEKAEQLAVPCFDAQASYLESQETSQATTGTTQSIDSTTRASLVSKLLLINSIIYGTDSFCGASELSSSVDSKSGVLGKLDSQIYVSLMSVPSGNTVAHLQSEWLPGDMNQVSAQSGYDFLKNNIGLDVLWGYSRNLAYTLYVLILVVIGFMIMFRKKINGQVYINVMNSLPTVVIGLILVTFSFAFAGIMMDVGKVAINVLGNIFTQIATGDPIEISSIGTMFTQAMDASAPEWKIAVPTAAGAYVLARAAEQFEAAGGIGEGSVWLLIINGIKLAATPIAIASLIVLAKYAIIGLVVIYASLKLFLTIVTTYLKLFMDVVTAPFYFLFGSLPGNSHIMMSWFKKIAAHVLTFILIFAIINLAWMVGLSGVLQGNLNFFNNDLSADIAPGWIITFNGILLIMSYFFAASAPTLANSILSVAQSKGMADAVGKTQKSFSKVPLVGSLMSK